MTHKTNVSKLTERWLQILDRLPEYPTDVTCGAFTLTTSGYRQGHRNRYYDAHKGRLFYEITPETVIYPCLNERVGMRGREITWMTATQDECESMGSHSEQAYGEVLLSGLGLGIAAWLSAHNFNTKSITVVEKQPEVIELIEPVIDHPKIKVINDDIYNYLDNTKNRYDFVSIDIWPDIGTAFFEYAQFRELCSKVLKSSGTVRTWMDELAMRLEREETVKHTIARINANYGRDFVHPRVAETSPCEFCGTLFHIDCYGFCLECCMRLGIIDAVRGGPRKRALRFIEKAKSKAFNKLLEQGKQMSESAIDV